MLLLLGIICVILGFAVKFLGMKRLKEDNSLKYGLIKTIHKENDGYRLNILYSPLRNEETVETSIWVKKKPQSTELIIKENTDGVEIYSGKKQMLCLSFVFWIVGALLCLLA